MSEEEPYQEMEVKELTYPYTDEDTDEEGFKMLDLHFDNKTVYKMKEKPYRVFKNIQKKVTSNDGNVNTGDMITKLISVSMVEPKMSDSEVDALPSSKAMMLTGAVAKLYNLNQLQQSFM